MKTMVEQEGGKERERELNDACFIQLESMVAFLSRGEKERES